MLSVVHIVRRSRGWYQRGSVSQGNVSNVSSLCRTKRPPRISELTVVLIGIASMLLVTVLYIGLGFAQNIVPDM